MKPFTAYYPFLILLFGLTVSQDTRAQGVIVWAETSADVGSVNAGETATFTIVVRNDSAVATATNPVVSVELPSGASNVSSAECVSVDTTLSCPLEELAPEGTAAFSFSTALNAEGHNVVEARVSVDQENLKPAWLSGDAGTSIVVVTTEEGLSDSSPVDLSVDLNISTSTELNLLYPAIVALKNLHNTNTVIAPAVELPTPEGWEIWPGKHCEPTSGVNAGEVVRCVTAPLLPESELELALFYKPVAIDGSSILNVLASSTQPEDNAQNNNAKVDVTIVPTVYREILCGASNPLCSGGTDNTTNSGDDTEPSDTRPELPSAAANGDSGGGTLTLGLLLVISGCIFFRVRRKPGRSIS